MSETDAAAFLKLVQGRRGHFRMESGYHSDLWFDLDPLFAAPKRVEPFVLSLATMLRKHNPDAVCGPLLGGAFLAQWLAHALGAEFAFTEKVNKPATGMFKAQYRLPMALARRLGGKRIAMVDDVMSAGSSLRATHAALLDASAIPVAVGALLILGDAGIQHFAQMGIAVEAPARAPFAMWPPEVCPLCAAGTPIENIASS
jgi:orotate phosphoribosyltransferase